MLKFKFTFEKKEGKNVKMMIIDVKIARTHVQRARYVRTWF